MMTLGRGRGVKNSEKSADVLYGSTQGVRQILKLVLICLLGRSKVVISSVEKKRGFHVNFQAR